MPLHATAVKTHTLLGESRRGATSPKLRTTNAPPVQGATDSVASTAGGGTRVREYAPVEARGTSRATGSAASPSMNHDSRTPSLDGPMPSLRSTGHTKRLP